MNKGRTPGWTDQHTGVALCVLLAAVGGLLAGLESGDFRLVVLGATVLCSVLALFFDGFIGIVIGLACAAATIVLKRHVGVWNSDEFMLAVAIAVQLTVLGWASGLVGSQIRRSVRTKNASDGAHGPAYGSLGLLTEQFARPRLEDEIARAREHGRSLGLLMIHLRITDDTLAPAARRSAARAVARLVESLLRGADVPFALSPLEFGAILPETDSRTGWSITGPLVDAASRATFTDRATQVRRSVADCAELHTGLVFLTDRVENAEALIAAARAAHGAVVADGGEPIAGRHRQVVA